MNSFGFTVLLCFSIIIPLIGIGLSVAGRSRSTVNPWCGNAPIVFFVAFLVGTLARTLDRLGGGDERILHQVMLGTIGLHVISALIALVGIAQVRRRRKWTHGHRRAHWTFWLNIVILGQYGIGYFFVTTQAIMDRLGG